MNGEIGVVNGRPLPAAVFNSEGRERLASIIVWGSKTDILFNRYQIERRIIAALELIAKRLHEIEAEELKALREHHQQCFREES